MRQGQVEVLAPAGSFESMKAAIGAGRSLHRRQPVWGQGLRG